MEDQMMQPQAAPGQMAGQQAQPQQAAQQASEEDVANFKRGLGAIAEVIYKNDQTANGILKMLPDGADQKQAVSGLVKASLTVLSEVDKQVNLPGETLIALAPELVERIGELAKVAGKFDFNLDIAKRAMAATVEGIIEVYGDRIIQEQMQKPEVQQQVAMLQQNPQMLGELKGLMGREGVTKKANQYKELF